MTTFDDALAVMVAEFGTPTTLKPRDPQKGRTHSEAWWYLPTPEGGVRQPTICLDDDDEVVGVAACDLGGSVKGWCVEGGGVDGDTTVLASNLAVTVRAWLDRGGV